MSEKATVAEVGQDGRLKANFFVAMRDRGMLNTMLSVPAEKYEAANKGMKCKWVYAPPNKDVTMVTAHESMGFKVVDNGELPGTESSHTSGPVRCGDMIMMAAPTELFELIADEDARRAEEDVRLPETAFRDNLEARKVQRTDGEMDYARPVGKVRRASQQVTIKPTGGE